MALRTNPLSLFDRAALSEIDRSRREEPTTEFATGSRVHSRRQARFGPHPEFSTDPLPRTSRTRLAAKMQA